MAATPTTKASGSQTATVTTEHVLLSTANAGVYVLKVDTVNMAPGDRLELRIKSKARAADTQRGCYLQVYEDAQPTDDLLKISLPIPVVDQTTDFTLTQTAGTGRAFPWEVEAL